MKPGVWLNITMTLDHVCAPRNSLQDWGKKSKLRPDKSSLEESLACPSLGVKSVFLLKISRDAQPLLFISFRIMIPSFAAVPVKQSN